MIRLRYKITAVHADARQGFSIAPRFKLTHVLLRWDQNNFSAVSDCVPRLLTTIMAEDGHFYCESPMQVNNRVSPWATPRVARVICSRPHCQVTDGTLLHWSARVHFDPMRLCDLSQDNGIFPFALGMLAAWFGIERLAGVKSHDPFATSPIFLFQNLDCRVACPHIHCHHAGQAKTWFSKADRAIKFTVVWDLRVASDHLGARATKKQHMVELS